MLQDYPWYEVKSYDLVVLTVTRNHSEADKCFRESTSRDKTLTVITPQGLRRVLKQTPEPRKEI